MLQPYLSPLRYRYGGYGIDVDDGTTNVALRNKLMQASAKIDTWCSTSLVPQKHDFRGGSITGEIQLFPYPPALLNEPGNRRIFLNHRPIRTVSAVSIEYTPQYSISLDSDQLFVSQQGFIEIVSINPTIIGFPPLGYIVGPYEPFASVDYTYGWRDQVTDDVLEAITPMQFMASHGSWLEGGDVTVEIDGVEVDPGDYSYNISDGTVTFVTAPTPGQVATVSYVSTLPAGIESAVGIVATDLFGASRLASRGMLGLSSLKVAEVSLSVMSPSQMVTKNGVSISADAASFLGAFATGTIA